MNSTHSVCNYSLLRFLPYPQTGELVNVGVLVSCLQPCLLHFQGEGKMPARVHALFPQQNSKTFEAAMKAIRQDVERITAQIRAPKSCKLAFTELVRPRENTFRFGEVRTISTADPQIISEELFRRYVRMESAASEAIPAQR